MHIIILKALQNAPKPDIFRWKLEKKIGAWAQHLPVGGNNTLGDRGLGMGCEAISTILDYCTLQKYHPECTKMHHFPLRSQKFFWGEGHSLPTPHPIDCMEIETIIYWASCCSSCLATVCYKPSVVGVGSGFRHHSSQTLMDYSGCHVLEYVCHVKTQIGTSSLPCCLNLQVVLRRVVSFHRLPSGLVTM